MRAALLALLLAGGALPAAAQAPCLMPPEPACLGWLGIGTNPLSVQLCRREVESYLRAMQDHIECLRFAQVAAGMQRDRVVNRFNACARGEFC